MNQPISAFSKIPLFSELDEQQLMTLSQGTVVRSYSKGQVLFNEGDLSDSLYIIFSGQLIVFLSDEDDKEIVLSTMGAGDYLGELALLADAPRSASIRVEEDCKVAVISRAAFENVMNSHSGIERALLKGLATRLILTDRSLRNLGLLSVYGRISQELIGLAKKEGNQFITQKLTQQKLAGRIGSSREMVSRVLKDLRAGGYITIKDKRIILEKTLPGQW